MLVVTFHTAFVDSGTHLVFEKVGFTCHSERAAHARIRLHAMPTSQLACDRACKDKVERYFDRAFAVEVFVERVSVGTLATEDGFNDYYRSRIAAAGAGGIAIE